MRNRLFLTMFLVTCSAVAAAQDGDLLQYQQEIGGGIGLMNYIGDANGSPFRRPGLAISGIWRRNLNQRMVIKADLGMGHISGDTKARSCPPTRIASLPRAGSPPPSVSAGT